MMQVLDSSRLRTLFVLIPAIVFWLCAPFSLVAGEASDGFEIGRIAVGFRGNFKVARWTPIRVEVTTVRPLKLRLTIGVADPDGNLTELPGELVDLPQAGSHTLKGLFRSGLIENDLHITVTSESQEEVSRVVRVSSREDAELRPALRHTLPLVATLGKPAGFVESPKLKSSSKKDSSSSSQPFMKVVELEGVDQLFRSALDFDTLDVLVIAAKYEKIDELQSEAVRSWVQSGGHLLLSVGSELAAYQKSRLASWVPVPIIGPSRLRAFHGLESYSGKNASIKFQGQFRSAPSAQLGPTEGRIAVSELDGPILVHVPFGFGKVTFLALDLDRPPISTWSSLAMVVEKIITERRTGPSLQHTEKAGALSHSGISDLATQIHAAQEHFQGISRFSTWMVMGLLLVYLLIIGPLDYLIVHRLLKKPRLTWITFPLMIIGAGTLAVWGASATNGSQMKMNQLDIVDIDEKSALMRTTTWLTFYSPQMRRYRVEVDRLPLAFLSTENNSAEKSSPAVSPFENRLRISWSGIPEKAFGGMYRSRGLKIARPSYQYATHAVAIDNLPVPIWSTRNLLATWHGPSTENLVTSQLAESGGGYLSGQIVHHLDGTLDDWILAYGKNVYLPAKGRSEKTARQLPAGKTLRMGRRNRTRVLKDYLSGTRRVLSEEEDGRSLRHEVLTDHDEYDPMNRDYDVIIRMLTFHNGAGGKGYTSLDNNVLRTFDLSRQLDMKRAVLFAKFNRRAAVVKLDGQNLPSTSNATYVRIILPVKSRERNDRFPSKSR